MSTLRVVLSPTRRGLLALVAALVLTGVAGNSVQALDGCFSALSTHEEPPSCCGKGKVDRIGKQKHDCCSKAQLAEHAPTSITSSTPDVPFSPVVTLPLSFAAVMGQPEVTGHAPWARDGPPDARPPTGTTVLLL